MDAAAARDFDTLRRQTGGEGFAQSRIDIGPPRQRLMA